MFRVEITHNFETAHRLSHPDAPIKCQSIHGHSWWATVWMEGEALDEQDMLLEFGAFKRAWRGFLDGAVDHHLMVHEDDPVAQAILQVQPDARILKLERQPTTEYVAKWVAMRTEELLRQLDPEGRCRLARVHIQETRVNAAVFDAIHAAKEP
ncbi:MAG: 6-carboxytetrahydropterin synthase [Myxococcota bacterium]